MKTRLYIFPLLGLFAAVLACNLSPATSSTLGPAEIGTLSAQTVNAMQDQTLAAQGTVLPQPGDTLIATAGPNDTATVALPTVTPTVFVPSVTNTTAASSTPVPCNWAKFITDVSIPDGWTTAPSDHFTKTWRLQNIGTCTWTSGYTLLFDHGDQMGAPFSQQLTPGTVAPGGMVDVSVDLVSPATAGTYQGFFILRAPDSTLFGIGPSANGAFWVKIIVATPTLIPPAVAPMNSQVFTQVTIASGNVGHATATCPAGSVVVGGGFAAGSNVIVYTHSMEGNGWGVYAKNNSGLSQLLNAYAVCLSSTAGSSQQILKQITIAAGGVGFGTASCPAGSVVTGGGFASSADYLWVYNSGMDVNGWSAFAQNTSGASQLFNIYGICLSGAGGSTSVAQKTVSIAGGASDGGEALCPAGTLVTGGGYALRTGLVIYASSLSLDRTKWDAYATNTSGSSQFINIFAVCWMLP